MHIVGQPPAPLEEWRPGVMTRMLVSAQTGASALCLFEQFVAPGAGAPTHTHTVEEVLAVLDGIAEIWLAEQRATLVAGQSVVVPPGVPHGFRNAGPSPLHVHATLAAPWFQAVFDNQTEARTRWQAHA